MRIEKKAFTFYIEQKNPAPTNADAGCFFAFPLGLLTQTELLNDSTITLDVLALEVVEERTALTYHLNE